MNDELGNCVACGAPSCLVEKRRCDDIVLKAMSDDIRALVDENERLRSALKPYADAFHAKVQNPKHSQVRRDWNERMPGEWPVELKVTMEQGRNARAALAERS